MSTDDGVAVEPPHAEFVDLLALWDATRRTRALPLWRDFRPERMAPQIFGRVFVVDVVGDAPLAFRYGLIGEQIVETFGRRATGRLIGRDLFSDEGETAIAFHADIVRRRRPCLGHGHAAWVGGRVPYEDLYLPFAREDGGAVAVMVGAMRFLGKPPDGEQGSVNEVAWQRVRWF